ncbi:Uma2 family endonuclease [Myxococcus sp. RHSTA-1-4]|uniref:Uma2 family endonuclease n=1 Tax=Myxococcus sp. RHSTA-1-4 TaxID=2874601 RepID=UPI001CBCF592|nr:Uma2 family endonuclease [Myxococcus sp. RHSTA-1-4]MBZ4416108.1 Uma2 family endonuclease [Myxococcus sp. RHSTA-1-4]
MSDKPRPPEDAYEELERLPPNVVGEIIAGELYVSPRPRVVHGRAAGRLFKRLMPFDEEPGQEGPGGWVLMIEPELHLGRDVLVPGLAGWRRERMPELPDVVGVELAPDWLCEVLSPSTETLDRARKMAVYAREGVKHLWLVDPRVQMLEVYRLENGRWLLLGTHTGNDKVHAEPFEVLPMDLSSLWAR